MATTPSGAAPARAGMLRLNQDNLKRTIGLPGAVGIAVNQIIGGGIVSLTGVAIAMTGGGAPLSYVIAAVAVMISAVPYAALGAAMPVVGGTYTWTARLIHPTAGFFLAWTLVMGKMALSLYGLAAGKYLHSVNPWFHESVVAIVLITFFFLANLAGAIVSARVGIVLMVVMIAGFLVFALFGLAQVDFDVYPEVMPHGLMELLSAAALLSFATAGAYGVAELGREMKKPGRDIPIAMIGGTAIVAVIYVLVTIPATGILPISEVADQPLSVVGAEFLPRGLWLFFIIGGALTAIISTMNAELLWGTKGLLAASDDGWLPRRLGTVNRRFGTPHWLLLILYVIGIMPVVIGLDVGMIGTAVSLFVQLMFLVVVVCSVILRHRMPAVHAASPFRLHPVVHYVTAAVAVALSVFQGYLLIADYDARVWLVVGIWLAIGAIILLVRYPTVRRTLAAREADAAVTSTEPSAVR